MRRTEPPWRLQEFLPRLDAWAAEESPPDDLRLLVTAWILTRYDDPYLGVRRADGFPNLWFGPVPTSDDGRGNVVTCTYWISEVEHLVTCDRFATLGLPH